MVSGPYLIGVLVAVLIAGYSVAKYRRGNWRKSDLLLALLVSAGIAAVSLFPQIGNALIFLFRLENRLFALLVFSNLLLFGMFFYLLNQVRLSNRRSGELVRALAKRAYADRYATKREPRDENGADPNRGELLIVMPAYNEQEAIRGVLARTPKEILGYTVNTLVVVDGSTAPVEGFS